MLSSLRQVNITRCLEHRFALYKWKFTQDVTPHCYCLESLIVGGKGNKMVPLLHLPMEKRFCQCGL